MRILGLRLLLIRNEQCHQVFTSIFILFSPPPLYSFFSLSFFPSPKRNFRLKKDKKKNKKKLKISFSPSSLFPPPKKNKKKNKKKKKNKQKTGKVDIGAFRTYPKHYTPPQSDTQDWQPIPQDKVEDFGTHNNRYYSLEVSFFKSSVDSHLLSLLWEKYWINTLASSSLLVNRVYNAGQITGILIFVFVFSLFLLSNIVIII